MIFFSNQELIRRKMIKSLNILIKVRYAQGPALAKYSEPVKVGLFHPFHYFKLELPLAHFFCFVALCPPPCKNTSVHAKHVATCLKSKLWHCWKSWWNQTYCLTRITSIFSFFFFSLSLSSYLCLFVCLYWLNYWCSK